MVGQGCELYGFKKELQEFLIDVFQDTSYIATQVHLLQEMFPGACSIEVRHCLVIAEGDVARAAQLVLHRQEAGQSLTSNSTVLQVR